MATTQGTVPPPPISRLEEFVFHPDQYETERIPKNIPREIVIQFIQTRIDGNTGPKALRQADKVVDFYDLQEVCPALRQAAESVPALINEILLLRMMAAICAPGDVAWVAGTYSRIASRASTVAEFQELVALNDALGPAANSTALRQQLQAAVAALEGRRKADYQAELSYHRLLELNNQALRRSDKANAAKDQILNIPDRLTRIAGEVRIYLTLDHPDLQAWAAWRLRREVWADAPSQQIAPADHSARRAQIVHALRQANEAIANDPEVPLDARPSLHVRCLRAIAFFGGVLTPDDVNFVRTHAGPQIDILSNE